MWINTKYHWWLVCINHLVTDSFSGCGSFHIHQKTKKKASYCVTQTWKASFFWGWGDSNLCNEKFSTQHRGWTFSPPLPGSALEPSRRNSQRRKSAASWSCGWCGATCALHSHKHKLLALRERTWHNNKHTRASFIGSNGPSLYCIDLPQYSPKMFSLRCLNISFGSHYAASTRTHTCTHTLKTYLRKEICSAQVHCVISLE